MKLNDTHSTGFRAFRRALFLAFAFSVAGSGCANSEVKTETPTLPQAASVESPNTEVATSSRGPLICKARKSKFRFDWQAASASAPEGAFDQNSVSFDFKAANRPAGERGENLKVGECGWAGLPMAKSKKEKSRVSYKRLSEEATETFYKLRTGKVFKVPVRQGKNGLTVPAGAPVTVVR